MELNLVDKDIKLYQTSELVVMLQLLEGDWSRPDVDFTADELLTELKTRKNIGEIGQAIINHACGAGVAVSFPRMQVMV